MRWPSPAELLLRHAPGRRTGLAVGGPLVSLLFFRGCEALETLGVTVDVYYVEGSQNVGHLERQHQHPHQHPRRKNGKLKWWPRHWLYYRRPSSV